MVVATVVISIFSVVSLGMLDSEAVMDEDCPELLLDLSWSELPIPAPATSWTVLTRPLMMLPMSLTTWLL